MEEQFNEAERRHIIFDNFDFIKDMTSRLPPGYGLVWEGMWSYRPDEWIMRRAVDENRASDYAKALSERRRGQRLVVIVAAGGVLYQFV